MVDRGIDLQPEDLRVLRVCAPVGQVRDLGGPLSVEGTLKLTGGGGFDMQALVAARPEATPELTNNIKFLGSPDASGRRQFAMSGSF